MSKTLVAYFSAGGVTKAAAQKVAAAAAADLFEIRPQTPYTAADLDWTNKSSRSSREMQDPSSRPAIAEKPGNLREYDTIFLGFPIWWYVAPTIIRTFLESCDLANKTIVLFATSGGSGFGKTAAILQASLPDSARLLTGKLLNGMQASAIRDWVDSLSL